jgi:hypothetical protein
VTHYDVHDALALQTLLSSLSISSDIMMKHSFSTDFVVENLKFVVMKNVNMQSLQSLVDDKIMSKFTVNKIAASGLHLQHIVLAYQRDKTNGVRSLFSEKILGKPRVTGNAKIIQSLQNYMMLMKI